MSIFAMLFDGDHWDNSEMILTYWRHEVGKSAVWILVWVISIGLIPSIEKTHDIWSTKTVIILKVLICLGDYENYEGPPIIITMKVFPQYHQLPFLPGGSTACSDKAKDVHCYHNVGCLVRLTLFKLGKKSHHVSIYRRNGAFNRKIAKTK